MGGRGGDASCPPQAVHALTPPPPPQPTHLPPPPQDVDSPTGPLKAWSTTPAPDLARKYWRLEPDATLRDLLMVVRADEVRGRGGGVGTGGAALAAGA